MVAISSSANAERKVTRSTPSVVSRNWSLARAMVRALARYPQVQVDWLFSGRERGDFFDMECFGAWQWRRGLSFATRAGRVRPLATLRQLSPGEFLRDMRALDLDGGEG